MSETEPIVLPLAPRAGGEAIILEARPRRGAIAFDRRELAQILNVYGRKVASGEWREDWNVNCGDGTFKTFPLTFTSQGGVINVTVGVP